MEDTYVQLINYLLHLFQSSASFFSSQYLLLFLKSSRSCVLLLPTPFTSVICPSAASWIRQFLLRIWPIQLAFLRRILFNSVLFSPISSRTCSFVTFSHHFIFSNLLQHHISKLSKYPAPIFIVSRSLSHFIPLLTFTVYHSHLFLNTKWISLQYIFKNLRWGF